MTILYTKLAHVYHEMYQSIFDYRKDFRQWDSILKRYGSKRVLELGCGAGDLAKYFLRAGYVYTGMDLAQPMIDIARRETPEARFVCGDMRRFSLARKFDAVVIGGRSFTYMTANDDVQNALRCIRRALKAGGILAFDNFAAERIFETLPRRSTERIVFGEKIITRRSKTWANLGGGWTWNWDAAYMVRAEGKTRTFRDSCVLRAFTRDELQLFLSLAGFTPVRLKRSGAVILTVAKAS
ncbi:MAG TPA: class I SAM-dependent methyltransferase [Bryobacteraceae bacterium]|nr:class I SAM-dependent methyltransferase [Bryobacteraceae bacterium]